jgi:hypothetical protein
MSSRATGGTVLTHIGEPDMNRSCHIRSSGRDCVRRTEGESALDRPINRKFLGFTVSRNAAKLKVADKALDKLKDRVREPTRRTRGTTFAVVVAEPGEALPGWKAYFGIAEVPGPLRDLDRWVLCPLRCHLWKQWGRAGYPEPRKRGVSVRERGIPASPHTVHGGCRRRQPCRSCYPCASSKKWDCRALRRGRNSIHRTAGYVTRSSGGVGDAARLSPISISAS